MTALWYRCAELLLLWLVLMLPAGAAENTLNASFRSLDGTPEARNFTLEDRFGNNIQLSEFRGRVVMVNFWATWCSPCLAELPTMQAAWALLSDSPFELLAINVGEERPVIDRFLEHFNPPVEFSVLMDLTMQVAREWQVRGVPTTYIVDQAGRLVYFAQGGLDFASEEVLGRISEVMEESADVGLGDTGLTDSS